MVSAEDKTFERDINIDNDNDNKNNTNSNENDAVYIANMLNNGNNQQLKETIEEQTLVSALYKHAKLSIT